MNKKGNHHDKTTDKVFPSHDSGGGGDSTVNHLTPRKSHHTESKHNDINSNKFLEKEEELGEDFDKIGAEIVKMVIDVAEERILTEGEEERPESANGKQEEVTQAVSDKNTKVIEEKMIDEGEMLPMKAQVMRQESVDGTEDEIVQDVGDKTTKERKRKDTNKEWHDLSFDNVRKLDRQQRSELYTKACTLQADGKTDEALKCFLTTLTGLTENNSFPDLPQCLHQVSNIYFEKNEYEKAVHFIQAEKMYYETALIDIVNLQKHIAEKRKQKEHKGELASTDDVQQHSINDKDTDLQPNNSEITKARELEQLARLCLKEGKAQLALEYCGKATKIYRSEYGDEHPVTVGSLDLFAIIYADVGKKLYEDAMERFGVEEELMNEGTAITSFQQQSANTQDPSTSTEGIRQRHKQNKTGLEKTAQSISSRRVHTGEYEPSPPAADEDDWVTTVLLMILFFLFTVLFALIFSYFYCRDNARSEMCAEFKGDLTYWYMRIQYSYKYYLGSVRK